jgi:NAD dependent epimerase/dehydratase family enzyme
VVQREESPYTNRIHSEDLAQICVEVGRQTAINGIYNVSDGSPGNMTDYFNAVADACGLARPPQISLAAAQTQLSAGLLSYMAESRRLDNRKLLRDTGLTLAYPDLDSGLRHCLSQNLN